MKRIRPGEIGEYLRWKRKALIRMAVEEKRFTCFLVGLIPPEAQPLRIAQSVLEDHLSSEGSFSSIGKLYFRLQSEDFARMLKAAHGHESFAWPDTKETHSALRALRQAWRGYVNIRVVRCRGSRYVLFRIL